MSTQNKKLFDYRFQFNIGTVIRFTWCNLAPVIIILHWLKVKITDCRFCIHRNFKSVFITEITKTELPKTLRSVNCHRKRIIASKLRSALLFKQITNYCKMYMCKNVQFHRICRCVYVFSFCWQCRFWIIHRSNHDTMSTTTLLLFAVDNWFHNDTAWFVLKFLLRSLTSFDGKVATRISIGFGAKKYEILRHLRITKPIFILLVISCFNFWQVASRELQISRRLCLYD